MTKDQKKLSVVSLASVLAVAGTVSGGVYKVEDSISRAIADERGRGDAVYASKPDVAVLTVEVRELRRAVDQLMAECGK